MATATQRSTNSRKSAKPKSPAIERIQFIPKGLLGHARQIMAFALPAPAAQKHG